MGLRKGLCNLAQVREPGFIAVVGATGMFKLIRDLAALATVQHCGKFQVGRALARTSSSRTPGGCSGSCTSLPPDTARASGMVGALKSAHDA